MTKCPECVHFNSRKCRCHGGSIETDSLANPFHNNESTAVPRDAEAYVSSQRNREVSRVYRCSD